MINNRIAKLRNVLKKYELGGYIIPSNDEHMNEYVPEHDRRLEFITGFTGSNGILILTQTQAIFFTDGRYLEQAKQQLDKKIFTVVDLNEIIDFTHHNLNAGSIGYDPKLFTEKFLEKFLQSELISIKDNLVDFIWLDKPKAPKPAIYLYPLEYSGENYQSKIDKCRDIIKNNQAEALIITAADSICWLLNLRSNDVPNTPLMLGKLIITATKTYLFINDTSRISQQVAQAIAEIDILDQEKFVEIITKIGTKILIDRQAAPIYILSLLAENQQKTINIADPCQLLKACKNSVEIQNAVNIHLKDAVAICEFLAQLDDIIKQGIDEYELSKILVTYRQKQSGYVMDSFPVICGYNENSAIIHYQAQKTTAKIIQDNGILLIDSGGQYFGGTTDVTRTIALGKVTKEQKKRYTQVLKGHIALASVIFPENIVGANLDVLARQYLWQNGLDYPHGTGHGVGNFLSVHEGPQNINLRNIIKLAEGMILSNEPGYYLPGEYGIRIENLQYVKKSMYENYFCFESLTLIPYDKQLIEIDLLNEQERQYIKNYYHKITEFLLDLLSPKAKTWLNFQIELIKLY